MQHPALARVAALQNYFWAHAPKVAAPVAAAPDPEEETTPASLLAVETLAAEYDYLEAEAFYTREPHQLGDAEHEELFELYANYNCWLAQLEREEDR